MFRRSKHGDCEEARCIVKYVEGSLAGKKVDCLK